MSDKLQFVVYFGQTHSRGNDKLKFIGQLKTIELVDIEKDVIDDFEAFH